MLVTLACVGTVKGFLVASLMGQNGMLPRAACRYVRYYVNSYSLFWFSIAGFQLFVLQLPGDLSAVELLQAPS